VFERSINLEFVYIYVLKAGTGNKKIPCKKEYAYTSNSGGF
jgi:hypothetical protein